MSSQSDVPEGSVIFFPEGLPGFETSQRFVLLRNPEFDPVLLLQRASDEGPSVPVIQARHVDPDYKLQVDPDDCRLLGFPEPPRLGGDVLCLFVLVLGTRGSPPQCNLFAPIVINPANLHAKQVMQIGSSYPSVFPLTTAPTATESAVEAVPEIEADSTQSGSEIGAGGGSHPNSEKAGAAPKTGSASEG